MRTLTALLLVTLLVTSASAAEWQHYSNGRFGYSIDVPPGFNWGPEADNGDGRMFREGATKLAVWGGHVLEESFESAVAAAIGFARNDGWAVTYEATTPGWANFSATQGKRVLYQRMVAFCDRTYAAFRLEHSAVDIAKLEPVVNRLVRSLRGDC